MLRELIVQTKLNLPKIRGRILRRERLLDALKQNLDEKLILICADAGHGKTTLLAQLCEEIDKPCVFYDLDAKDNNVATFFSYLVAGVRKHAGHFGESVKDIIFQTDNIEIIVGTFINEFMEKIKKDFYIILDDYHYLQSNQKICNALDYFLHHLPLNLHFIISSRANPPVNLPHYLAKQELMKIEKEQLRFNIQEIQSLFKDVYGLRISPTEIERIAEFSKGWITVLQLILQKIRASGEETTKDTLNNYAASDDDIFNYFAREVFEQTPKRVRDFTMKTSILEYLNPGICDYLLNSRDSKRIIDYLDTENMFISRVGDNFEYHPLFQEFLHRLLKNNFTNKTIKKLHNNAGNCLLTMKDYSSAVRHLLSAECYAKAAKILERNYRYWITQTEYPMFIQLVDGFPTSTLENHPYLLLRKTLFLKNLDRNKQALECNETALKMFRKKKDREGIAEGLALKAQIHFTQSNFRKSVYYINKAYRLIKHKDTSLKADILMKMGGIYRDLCSYGKAKMCFEEALKLLRKFKDKHLEESLLRSIALLHFTISNFKEADRLFMEIFSKFNDQLYGLNLGYMYSTVAAINIDAGNFPKAWEYLVRAENTVKKYNDRWIVKYLVYIRGKLHLVQGDYYKAIELLEKALNMYKEGSKRLDPWLLFDIIDAYFKLDKIDDVRMKFNSMDALLNNVNERPNLFIYYQHVKGILETTEGKFSDALESFNCALRTAKKIHKPYQAMIIYYELSKCYLKKGDEQQALACFKRCLRIAHEGEYDVFLSIEARHDLGLFKLGLDNDCAIDYILQILEKTDSDEARDILNMKLVRQGFFDLRCRLFGPLQIRDTQGRLIRPSWRTSNTKMLFTFLIANPKKKYTRDQLIDTFWPEKNVHEATRILHVEISALRKLLKDMLKSEINAKNFILYQNKNYFLNPYLSIRTDIGKFEKLVNEASEMESRDKNRRTQLYKRALGLYRGDFCADVDGEWCEDTRMHYKNVALKILKKLGQIYYEDKNFKKSLEFFGKALRLDPYDEAIHSGITHCLAVVKAKDGVQRQYKMLINALRKSGVRAPSSETIKIYQASLGDVE